MIGITNLQEYTIVSYDWVGVIGIKEYTIVSYAWVGVIGITNLIGNGYFNICNKQVESIQVEIVWFSYKK